VVFCTVVLITGPIWGRRAWGIWWTWDARLTTTLVLWLIYVSYLLLRRFAAGPQMQTLAAVLGIFGALDVPIVYMSNRWWRTQHPAPVFGGAEGSGMDPAMVSALSVEHAGMVRLGHLLILALRYQRRTPAAEDRRPAKPSKPSTPALACTKARGDSPPALSTCGAASRSLFARMEF
jgi:heme exporter protein C